MSLIISLFLTKQDPTCPGNALEDLLELIDQAGVMAEQNRDKMRMAADMRLDTPISTIVSFNRQLGIKKETG